MIFKKPENKSKTVAFRVEQSLYEKLLELANKNGVNISFVINEILKGFFNAKK